MHALISVCAVYSYNCAVLRTVHSIVKIDSSFAFICAELTSQTTWWAVIVTAPNKDQKTDVLMSVSD